MVEQLRKKIPVSQLCRELPISRSGYCAWRNRRTAPPCKRRQEDARLLPLIEAAHKASRGAYGYPRVYLALRAEGETVGPARVARLMCEAGICGLRTHRRRIGTTSSDPAAQKAANILNREFTAATPDQKWVADVTYVETQAGWLYLAVVLDLYARKVVGWATSADFNAALVCKALENALATRKAPALHHSDRGVQYTSLDYQKMLAEAQIQPSMSRVAQPYDNAVMESFFATIKEERLHKESYVSHRQAKAAIFEYIESFYNVTRFHSTNGGVSPNSRERAFQQAQQAMNNKNNKNSNKSAEMEKATTTVTVA